MPSSDNNGGNNPKSTTHDLSCLTILELERLAHDRMDKQTRDYYNEGADAGSTLLANSTSYARYRIVPRVLRDISAIDTRVRNLFGDPKCINALPLGVAPTAMQCLAHTDGELATARACQEAGVVMGLSSFATQTLEDVAVANGENARVLQLYLFEERAHSQKLIERAKRAGYKAVFLTVDTPMLGRRNMEIRNQFKLPAHLKIANFTEDEIEEVEEELEEEFDGKSQEQRGAGHERISSPSSSTTETEANTSRPRQRRPSTPGYTNPDSDSSRMPPSGPITFHTHAANPTLTWASAIPWLKEVAAPMQVWVKGILSPHDAVLAMEHGCDGIVVSNHGGRQLDGAISTLDALPGIVEAVNSSSCTPSPSALKTNAKNKIPIHIDGGIRHGSDIFKALALGADFTWVGRPVLWGLAYKGEEGVALALRLLGDEVRLCMGLAGCKKVADINQEYLVRVKKDGGISKL